MKMYSMLSIMKFRYKASQVVYSLLASNNKELHSSQEQQLLQPNQPDRSILEGKIQQVFQAQVYFLIYALYMFLWYCWYIIAIYSLLSPHQRSCEGI
jgi:hypothetical protein